MAYVKLFQNFKRRLSARRLDARIAPGSELGSGEGFFIRLAHQIARFRSAARGRAKHARLAEL